MKRNIPAWMRDDDERGDKSTTESPSSNPETNDISLGESINAQPNASATQTYADSDEGQDISLESRRAAVLEQFRQIRILIEHRDLRAAEAALETLLTAIEGHDDLADIAESAHGERLNIEAKRVEYIRELQSQIDDYLETPITLTDKPAINVFAYQSFQEEAIQIINESVEIWETEIYDRLEQWRQLVSHGKRDNPHERRINRTHEYVSAERQRLFVEVVQMQCEEIWRLTEQDQAKRIAPLQIIERYKAAIDAAQLALGRYPDDSILKSLVSTAEIRRAHEALASQIKTSAVQEEEYGRALDDLDQLPDNYPVPDYMFTRIGSQIQEQFKGRITVRQMRDELTRQAREWALARKAEYVAAAELALAAFTPGAATAALEKSSRLYRFLQTADRNDILDVQRRIEDQKRRQDSADMLKAQAQAKATSDPFAAWRLYQDAYAELDDPEWAKSYLRDTRSFIENLLRQNLADAMALLEKALADRRFTDVYAQANEIELKFQRFDDPTIQQETARAKTLSIEAQEIERARRALAAELERLERQITNGDPQYLQNELDRLRQAYLSVAREVEAFDRISQQVALRQSIEVQVSSFKATLINDDYETVERELHRARAARIASPNDDALRLAEANLETHFKFLSGLREAEAGQFDRAAELFERVEKIAGHPDHLRAKQALEELEQNRIEQTRAKSRIDAAEARVDKQPVPVYEELASLGVLSSRALERQRQDLLNRAMQQGKTQQISRLNRLKRNTSNVDSDEVMRLLDALNTLGLSEEREEWARYFEPLLAWNQAEIRAQSAKMYGSETDWREAIRLYEATVRKARELGVDARELRRYEKSLVTAQRSQVELQLANLKPKAAALGSDAAELIPLFTELDANLRKVFEADNRDGEVVLWIAQLSELRARYSISPEHRARWFRQAEADGRRAIGLLSNHEKESEARVLILKSARGVEYAANMLSIDADFAANTPENLRHAQEMWRTVLEPDARDVSDDYFRYLLNWWGNRIHSQLGGETDRDDFFRPDQTLILSKIVNRLLLNPDDPAAVTLIDNLDQAVGRLQEKVNRLALNAVSANEVTGDDGLAKLASQLSDLKDSASDFEALANLMRFFGTDNAFPYANKIAGVYQQIGSEMQVLQQRNRELQDLHRNLQTARQQLNTARANGAFSETQKALSLIQPSYSDHPAVEQVRRELATAQQERADLLARIPRIQKAIEDGEYLEARQQMRQIGINTVSLYGLTDAIRITDSQTGDAITFWGSVETELGKLNSVLDKVIGFATPFDHYVWDESLKQARGELTGISDPVQRVVDWEQEQQDVRAALEQGEFSRARDLLAIILDGDSRITRVLGLNTALARIEFPPNGQGSTVEERYAAAESAAASSVRARRLLQALQTKRLPALRTYLKEALALQDEITAKEHAWQQGLSLWEQAVYNIAVEFQKAGGLKKRPRGEPIYTALQQAWAAFDQCRGACPKHRLLIEMVDVINWSGSQDNYRGLWLFRWAALKTKYKPALP
jgi:hypothetical protein